MATKKKEGDDLLRVLEEIRDLLARAQTPQLPVEPPPKEEYTVEFVSPVEIVDIVPPEIPPSEERVLASITAQAPPSLPLEEPPPPPPSQAARPLVEFRDPDGKVIGWWRSPKGLITAWILFIVLSSTIFLILLARGG